MYLPPPQSLIRGTHFLILVLVLALAWAECEYEMWKTWVPQTLHFLPLEMLHVMNKNVGEGGTRVGEDC